MKILFIKPKTDLHAVVPPINFLYLAGHLKKHDVRVIDAHCYKLSDEQIIKKIKEFSPDIIGFGGLSSEINFALNLAEKVKKISKAKIVFGGVHTTNEFEEILSKPYVDFIFRAESELPFADFVDRIEHKKSYSHVFNLGYIHNSKIILNEIKLYDFNLINMPDWDLIKLKDYPKLFIHKKTPSAPIFTSRGCPFSCTFCSSFTMNGRGYRERKIEKVIEELKYIKRTQGINEFYIWDENFSLKKERVIKFCNTLIEEEINLCWNCPNGIRVDTLDDEVIKKMKQAGCWAMSLAIEFPTQRMLDIVNKKTDIKKIKKIAPLIERNGINTTLFFIIGHPEETEEEMQQTIDLSLQIPASRAYFSIYKTLPGSQDYYKYGKEKGRIIFSEGSKKIKKIQRRAILKFYLRPKQFLTAIRDNFSSDQIKEVWQILKSFVLK